MNHEKIIDYYESCDVDYKLLWDLDHSQAMHAGYWDSTTKSLRDALRRENEVLAEIAKIRSTDRVLDAGCGVGGSSIFLAKKYQCEVVGITLSKKQVLCALKNGESAKVNSLVNFQVVDYINTGFPDQSFDVVWAIESVCHAHDKALFLKEAFRLLRPSGRIVIADGFIKDKNCEDPLMKKWLRGWGVDSLETVSSFQNFMNECGFKNITFQDITSNVWSSAKRLYFYSLPAIFLSKAGEWFGFRTKLQTDNLYSARCQYLALKKNLWQYGIFYGEKQE